MHIGVDVPSYMDSIGRYANLFQTKIVQSFFNDSLDLHTLADVDGTVHVSFQDVINADIKNTEGHVWTKSDDAVTINQYVTDIQSENWAMRAFVFGSTAFGLSRDTTFFNIDSDGHKSIVGGVMLPCQDNFDFSSKNPFVQFVNNSYLHGLVDSYDIGRKVWFDYSDANNLAYALTHAGDTYTAADAPTLLDNFVSGAETVFSMPGDVAATLAGLQSVRDGVAAGADYIHDGHNVVFGSNAGSSLNASSGKGSQFDTSLPNIFIGGEGTDYIVATGSDEVFAGAGDDTVLVKQTPTDQAPDHVEIRTGPGSDMVAYDNSQGDLKVNHYDKWFDADASDSLAFNFDVLNGGTQSIQAFSGGYVFHNDGNSTYYVSADADAAYEYHQGQDDLHAFLRGGNSLDIVGFHQGDAGLNVFEDGDIPVGNVEGDQAAIFNWTNDGSFGGDLYYQGLGAAHQTYSFAF